jgi:hypothetical protein
MVVQDHVIDACRGASDPLGIYTRQSAHNQLQELTHVAQRAHPAAIHISPMHRRLRRDEESIEQGQDIKRRRPRCEQAKERRPYHSADLVELERKHMPKRSRRPDLCTREIDA